MHIKHNDYGFIDFDEVGYNYILYDLAVFYWSCFIRRRIDNWDIFFKHYTFCQNINFNDLRIFILVRDFINWHDDIERVNKVGYSHLSVKYLDNRKRILSYFLKDL